MIDFRYHLVSLAAVLIALSIGIVLGAGPLEDNIGSTLSGEVTRLRQEKEDLRAQSQQQRQAIQGRDRFEEAVLPRVVAGRLSDHTVAVIALPEADEADVEEIRGTLGESGAEVPDTIRLTSAWSATTKDVRATRRESGEAALRDLGVDPAVPAGAQRIDQALAVTVTGRGLTKSDPDVSAAARRKAWDRLREARLVDGPRQASGPADLVLVLGGPIPAREPAESGAIDRGAERTAVTWVALTHVLDRYSEGTVLAAKETDPGTSDASPVTMARIKGNFAEGVSTVDVPEDPMGRGGIVLALREQVGDRHGHYGLGTDADAAVPDVP